MKKLLITIVTLFSLTVFANANVKDHQKEITEGARKKAAITALMTKPNTIQLYAKGLVCESCAVGIRKKLQKLKFVDKSQAKNGIILDVRTQLVSISLRKGSVADKDSLIKAIKGAGYDPVMLYQLNKGGKFQASSLRK